MIEKGRAESPEIIICNKISLLLVDPFLRRSRYGWEENFELDRISGRGPNLTGPFKFQYGAL